MAAVYKTVSKSKTRQPVEPMDDEDIDMEDLLNEADDTSTDSEEDEEEQNGEIDSAMKHLAAGYMPKTRVLVLTSRGVTHRYGFNLQNAPVEYGNDVLICYPCFSPVIDICWPISAHSFHTLTKKASLTPRRRPLATTCS